MKIAYDYFFYTLYRFWETSPISRNSEDRAVVFLSMFITFLFISINLQIIHFFSVFSLEKLLWPVIGGLLLLWFNQYYFLRNDKWVKRIEKFKYLSREKNRIFLILTVIFWGLVVTNLIFSFRLIMPK